MVKLLLETNTPAYFVLAAAYLVEHLMMYRYTLRICVLPYPQISYLANKSGTTQIHSIQK